MCRAIPDDDLPPLLPDQPLRADSGVFRTTLARLPEVRQPWLRAVNDPGARQPYDRPFRQPSRAQPAAEVVDLGRIDLDPEGHDGVGHAR
jgi:hypothetical protein